MFLWRSVFAVLLLALMVGIFGCAAEEPTEVSAKAAKLPANFPDDFPVYPGVKVITSDWSLDVEGDSFIEINWSAPGLVSDVTDFYFRELPKKKWGHLVTKDLQTKVIKVWRKKDPGEDKNRLTISPIDPTGAKDGVNIQVELFL